ncbi:MAG: hypothetical protein Q9Q40_08800 [Acidobacteriota bacterium]|nr:hypothetical protein [Acidobacteriota bacterium]
MTRAVGLPWVLGLLTLVAILPPGPYGRAASERGQDLARVMSEVEKVRGLPFLRQVPVETPAGDEGRALLARLVARELPDDVARSQARILEGLQLLPGGYDLRGELEKILRRQALGLYDGERGVMVIFGGHVATGGPHPRTVWIHEYDHALIDQHFGFERRRAAFDRPGREDRQLAWLALAEGDAVLTMLLATAASGDPDVESFLRGLDEPTAGGASALDRAPAWVRTLLLEPYRLGTRLVAGAWRRGGWEAVNALWREPPLSTEQLLHADRRGELPGEPAMPPPPDGWRRAGVLQLGELGIGAWLGTRLDRAWATRAAAGWDGDRVELLEAVAGGRPGGEAPRQRLRVLTAWDSGRDVAEFVDAVVDWLDQAQETVARWTLRQSGRNVEIDIDLRASPAGGVEVLDDDPWSGVAFTGPPGGG